MTIHCTNSSRRTMWAMLSLVLFIPLCVGCGKSGNELLPVTESDIVQGAKLYHVNGDKKEPATVFLVGEMQVTVTSDPPMSKEQQEEYLKARGLSNPATVLVEFSDGAQIEYTRKEMVESSEWLIERSEHQRIQRQQK